MAEVRTLVDTLSSAVDIFKIGSQLFTACGPAAVRFIQARKKKVFLDLKYHDIPNTVANAVRVAVNLSAAVRMTEKIQIEGENLSIFIYTVHIQGGKAMLRASVKAGMKQAEALKVRKPLVVGVTVLTSEEKKANIRHLVLERAFLAKEVGLDGVVASSHEASFIRKELGHDFLIVTPGIRPTGVDVNDQKRIATPRDAILNGSNYLVVGRPIIKAEDPLKATQKMLEEMEQAK